MKCKYCDQELVEGKRFCPSCGKENLMEEETPVEAAPAEEIQQQETVVETEETVETAEIKEGVKMTPGKLALTIVGAVAVLALLIALIVNGTGSKLSHTNGDTGVDAPVVEVPEAIDEIPEPTIPADGNPNDATCKGSYTVSDEEVIAHADTIVATMGDEVLTNAELQVYYWMEVMNFLSNYGSYASYFGLDMTQPLDTQVSEDGSENPPTWQQYFLACALDTWASHQALTTEAKEVGHVMGEDFAGYLASVSDDLEANAVAAGLENGLELVQLNVGMGADVDDYLKFMELYYNGYSYFNELYEQLQFTTEDIEAYFAENEEYYLEMGISKDSGEQMSVRHILVMVQGGTADEAGNVTYTDEEWETCRAAAQEILDLWLEGDATEETFAELAALYSEDGGSSSNGGLYEGLTAETNFVENFKNWYLEEGRKAGDYGLVQTEYGYHVMFFSGTEPVWFATAEADLLNERANAILPDCVARHPFTIDYSAIKLGFVELGQ